MWLSPDSRGSAPRAAGKCFSRSQRCCTLRSGVRRYGSGASCSLEADTICREAIRSGTEGGRLARTRRLARLPGQRLRWGVISRFYYVVRISCSWTRRCSVFPVCCANLVGNPLLIFQLLKLRWSLWGFGVSRGRYQADASIRHGCSLLYVRYIRMPKSPRRR
jgi:hypothetical protein